MSGSKYGACCIEVGRAAAAEFLFQGGEGDDDAKREKIRNLAEELKLFGHGA